MSMKLVSRLLAALLVVVIILLLVPRAHGKRAGQTSAKLTGILTAKGGNWIEVQADGEQAAKRYYPCWQNGHFDPAMLAVIGKLLVNNRVQLAWITQEQLRIVSVTPLVPPTKTGVVEGTVTAKGDTWIEIKPKKGKFAARYTPQWLGGLAKNGGGFDKDILQALTELNVGDQVGVKWQYDGQNRVAEIWQL